MCIYKSYTYTYFVYLYVYTQHILLKLQYHEYNIIW